MSRNDDSAVLADIASGFLGTLFELESTEGAELPRRHEQEYLSQFSYIFLNGSKHRPLFNAGAFGNLGNNLSFSHNAIIMMVLNFIDSVLMVTSMLYTIIPFLFPY